MLYSSLRGMFYDLIGDNSSSPVFISTTNADYFFNAALEEMVYDTKCVESTADITLSSGTSEYSFPSDCDEIFRVTHDGEMIWPITQRELRSIDREWRDQSGQISRYYLDTMNYRVGFFKEPDTAAAARTTTAYYSAIPTAITLTTQYPEVPEWASYGLVWGALAQAYMANTDLRDKNKAAFYRALFELVKARLQMRARSKINQAHKRSGIFDREYDISDYTLPDRIPTS